MSGWDPGQGTRPLRMTLSPDPVWQPDWLIRSTDIVKPDCDQQISADVSDMATNPDHQSYGVKCEPDMNLQCDYYQPSVNFLSEGSQEASTDMDLTGFLDSMDDRVLSELTSGAEWNSSLFNGQLDDVDALDPTTGMHGSLRDPSMAATITPMGQVGTTTTGSSSTMDRWLMDETMKLERQQKLHQQKLMELQQTLIKTEIIKNQLQIASISSQTSPTSPTPHTTNSLLNVLTSTGHGTGNFNLSPASSVTGAELANSVGTGTTRVPIQRNVQPPGHGSSPTVSVKCGNSSPASQKPKVPPPPPTPPGFEPDKRKVHNLIEKKYRCSINDRIVMLREMVSKGSPRDPNKRLQKSAVLQKTIDHIRHLENTIKRLQEENSQLKDALKKATGKLPRFPSFTSPPSTPQTTISPTCSESGDDSGHPYSPEDYDENFFSTETSPPSSGDSVTTTTHHHHSQPSLLASHLMQGTMMGRGGRGGASNFSQYLLCVLLVAVFFINPLSFTGQHLVRSGGHVAGGMRSLSASEEMMDPTNQMEGGDHVTASILFYLFWALRVLIAAGCFGYLTLKSMPRVTANSSDAVRFWRFRKQAENDLQKGEFVSARENLEVALAVISRPIPTSYYGIVTGLMWTISSHVLFQLIIGRFAVSLASMFVRNGTGGFWGSRKKVGFEVTFHHVSNTYHLLHQINMASTGGINLHGTGFYLALNALNFAEAARPYHSLSDQKLSEMFFSLGLQCHFSLPYGSTPLMWYYFFCSRNANPSKFATPLKWTVTPQGKRFLLSAKWASEVKLGSRLYQGPAALPLYSVTRAFCKDLLRKTFTTLLLPDTSEEGSHDLRSGEPTSDTFKYILNLAKEANSSLLAYHSDVKSLSAAARSSDSGFTVIQWWSAVGLVASYWSTGEDKAAEDYYACIDGLSGDSAPARTALHLAFKASRLLKRPKDADGDQMPVNVLLQLCSCASDDLKICVADVLQDHTNSTETELHQLGLLLACDWLLGLRTMLWEEHGKEEGVMEENCMGFYQDLDTLSKLVTLLPPALSRFRLYKGCYQLMAGANPMQAQAMLNSTSRASFLRKRGSGKESSKHENPAACGQEHAMARLLAYKHLPPSLELPSISTSSSQRPSSDGNCRKGCSSSSQSKETNI